MDPPAKAEQQTRKGAKAGLGTGFAIQIRPPAQHLGTPGNP